jgi:hypothetical protein
MKQRRQSYSDSRALTAQTSIDAFGTEETIASDTTIQYSKQTSAPAVGHTAIDLLYDKGLSGSVAKLIGNMDAIEVLATTSYVLLGLFKSGNLVMRFWVFLALLAGYHVFVKPVASLLTRALDQIKKPPTQG